MNSGNHYYLSPAPSFLTRILQQLVGRTILGLVEEKMIIFGSSLYFGWVSQNHLVVGKTSSSPKFDTQQVRADEVIRIEIDPIESWAIL